MIEVDGVELCAEAFGDPADPPILLIMGVGGSMDYWEPEFCRALTGRYVIRYDHRDTGQSVGYPPGEPGYRAETLVSDAVGVLDAFGLAKAHIVGLSMGGGIAQELALGWPDRVATLTLLSTTAGFGDPDLPGVDPRLTELPAPDWADREAVVEHLVAEHRQLASPNRPFDEAAVREVVSVAVARTRDLESSARNHHEAPGDGGSWRHRLSEIAVPTLVMHGTDDPLFPLPHGIALAREIPGARFVELPDTGHELPRENWPVVVRELLAHTA